MMETKEQREKRRMAMGLNNPKHDRWSRRKRYYNPMAKVESIVKGLKWWQRIYIAIILVLKRLWRKLFKNGNIK